MSRSGSGGGYTRVRTSGAYQAVVRQLEERVASGRLPPGARLPAITELARSLGVSVPVVREAVMSLRARGLVDVRHGSGTYVAEPAEARPGPTALPRPNSVGDVLALLEARLPLEVRAAELAAAVEDRSAFVVLDAAIAAMARAQQAGDDEAFLRAYSGFHLDLATVSGNLYLPLLLAPILDALMPPSGPHGGMVPVLPARAAAMLHHRALVAALRDGNAEVAALVMRDHLGACSRLIRNGAGVYSAT